MLRYLQRGDTMIEVLFAITIFSIVAVGGLTIMNKGAASAQRSLEITLVRQEMDAQAEALRMMYDEAIAEKSTSGYNGSGPATTRWQAILDKRVASATAFSDMVSTNGVNCRLPSEITGAFVVNARTGVIDEAPVGWNAQPSIYARIIYQDPSDGSAIRFAEGIWIEAIRGTSVIPGVPEYTDFHIRACWSTVGQSRPVTLGTIVRLHEPSL